MSDVKLDIKVQIDNKEIVIPINAAERLYEELKKIIGNRKISRSNIVIILLSLMQVVEKYDDVHGVQKKALILNAINHLIDDQIDDEQETMEMKLLVKLTLPSVIDTFVNIDNKKLQIKLNKTCSNFFTCYN